MLVLMAILWPSITLGDENSAQQLPFHVLSDVSPQATIEQVCCSQVPNFPGQTVLSTRSNFNGNPVWLKIDTANLSDFIQLSPVLDKVTLFIPTGREGEWREIQTGDLVAQEDRATPMPFLVLPIPKNLREKSLYIRIEQAGIPLVLEVKTWSPSELLSIQSSDLVIKMALLGFIGAMVFYNLFVSVIVADKVFALNALTILSLLLVAFYLSGYGAAYIWPSMSSVGNVFLLAGTIGGIVFGSLFIWLFIKQEQESFFAGWLFFVAPVCAIIGFISLSILPYQFVHAWVMGTGLLTFLIALPIIFLRVRRGHREATILLWPMTFAIVPGIVFLVLDKYFGMNIAQTGNNGMEITLCLEAIFFSLALASRIRITESKHRLANENLLALRSQTTSQIISAQDQERQRISKELHDGVGQNLLVVLGNLKRMANSKGPVKLREEIADQAGIATMVLNDLRRISLDMYPMTLEHLGLERSIVGLLEAVEEASGIVTSIECNYLEGTLSPATQFHLYRIVQECLANIMRHSHASNCQVSLQQTGDNISLTVQDNGQGIGSMAHNSGGSMGLGFTSIEDRARAIGAICSRKNVSSGGLQVKIVLKYAAKSEIGVQKGKK